MPKDSEQRWVNIPPDLAAYLKELPRDGRWVLGAERPSLGVMTAYMKKVLRRNGLQGNIHTLRHTFASHLVIAGRSLKEIAKLLGHSTTATTEIYAHLAPESKANAVSALPVKLPVGPLCARWSRDDSRRSLTPSNLNGGRHSSASPVSRPSTEYPLEVILLKFPTSKGWNYKVQGPATAGRR